MTQAGLRRLAWPRAARFESRDRLSNLSVHPAHRGEGVRNFGRLCKLANDCAWHLTTRKRTCPKIEFDSATASCSDYKSYRSRLFAIIRLIILNSRKASSP